MTVSVRSYLTAGVAALAATAVAVAPVQAPAPQSISTAAVRLSAAVQPLVAPANAAAAVLGLVSKPAAAESTGTPQAAVTANNAASDAIINIYNAAEPWVQWGFAVAAWAASYVPIAGYFAQQINIAYNTGEPIVGSLVFSFAALLDGQVATIPSILQTGVTTAVNNFIQGEIQWIAGYLPPLPPLPFAATAPSTSAVPAAAAGAVAAPAALPRSVNPAHALRTRIVAAVEDAVAPATDAVEGTKKTVVDPTDVKADPQDQVKADASDTPDVTSGGQDAVKETGNSARGSAKKVRSAAGSARDHSVKKRAAHDSGE